MESPNNNIQLNNKSFNFNQPITTSDQFINLSSILVASNLENKQILERQQVEIKELKQQKVQY